MAISLCGFNSCKEFRALGFYAVGDGMSDTGESDEIFGEVFCDAEDDVVGHDEWTAIVIFASNLVSPLMNSAEDRKLFVVEECWGFDEERVPAPCSFACFGIVNLSLVSQQRGLLGFL